MAASQAFHSRTGSLVTLSNGNRTAQRNHPTQEFNNGIVISKDPLRDNEIFEVIIDKKVNSWSGSIEIGVSTQDPAHLDFPTSATSLREGAWIMSGCSILRDGRSVMDEYGRDLDQLNQGDRVGVQRTLNGELHIYIKGVDQGCAAKGLPASVYAVVDMYGKCIQVSIVNHDRRSVVLPVNGLEEDILARIPSTFQRSASNEVLRFHERCGSLIKLSNNNRTAERRRPLEEFNNGVVMTNRPLRDNELFEIRIDRLVDKWSGSIEMGITTHNPGLLDFPATMTNMRTGTIMMSGCGILTNGKGTRREYGEFNLDELTEGDYVGLVRKANGTLHYYINGLDQGVASSRTPQTVYGVVDLYGMTVKVTITDRDTLSPIYERLERRSFFGLNSGNSEYNEDANGEQNERILFHSNCGAHAMVINNGKTALRPHAMDDFNNGVILTNRPLRNNEVFEVRLDEIVDKWAGSIEIGVTTHSPREIEFPSTMTNIRSGTWMMTGNGIMHNGTTVIDEYGQNLDRLGVGDCVGVMRKENGTLHFYVNGIDQGTAAYNIPDVLYAVIDLYGQAAEASIIDSSDPVQQMDNNPNSVRSMRRTSNITLTQDEQTNDLRFHHLHGANAMITNNGLTACRPNATGEFNDAIVMSNRTLRTGELFEVVIEKMVDRWSGSIEAGVTAIHPTDLDFPSTMTDIDYNTWMLSGSAVMQDGTTVKNGYLLDLDTISVNSRIGMMRALDGSLHYFVDGVDMGVACTDIAENVYAVIDLYGQCSQATIVQSTIRDNHTLSNSSNALLIEHPIPSVHRVRILHKFHQYCGKNISIRSSGCSAYRIRSFNHGIIFSSRPLKTGELFEVKVEQVSKRWSGSLQIGLTTFVPSEALPVNSLPPAASELRTNRNTWLMQGSEVLENGVSLKENYATTLDRLEIGNTVGVKRCSDDTMHVVINGEDKGIAASNIPKGSYAIIDLYGTTEGVTITSSAVEYPDSSRAPSIASDLSDEIEEINGHMESVQEPVCIEFQENHGKNIQLCNGNLTACRTASYNQGVVVSSKPLPIMQRFQIRIDRLNSRWTSSLQIGVLGFSPEKLNFPPTASTIKRCCWVVQSDSVFHNGVKVKEKFGPNLDTLQIGHKVGIMLDNDHSLHYYVNDVDQGMAAKNIPFGSFAVVDLYGQCEQVTIVADDSSMAASLPVEGREKQDMEDGLKESVCPTPPLTDNVIRNCEYQNRCIRFKSTIGLPDGYFESDPKMSICYCETCHKIRGDEPYYKKGQPPKDYALPFGWCKFALRVMPRAQLLNAFKEWHIAYHGTKVGHIRKVLDKGELVLPDPKSHSWQVARVVFQICVKPGSYKCGPPSVGANEPIDPQFSNNEIEWYSKEKGAIILQSLLVKID
uniref:Neuralized-like protein 4-like n=1 Tax=Saccoglossus kowalevskii TaxID=10224 RepID=A0ABM0M096_SACKO|nr:PREDICTED: neuralized-like protein 4-like [Saccoglossus kowalevskii]